MISCVESCERQIRDLQGFLDSVGPIPNFSNMKGKMKKIERQLVYGLRQRDTASLLRSVQGLTLTAGNAAQPLNIYVFVHVAYLIAGLI